MMLRGFFGSFLHRAAPIKIQLNYWQNFQYCHLKSNFKARMTFNLIFAFTSHYPNTNDKPLFIVAFALAGFRLRFLPSPITSIPTNSQICIGFRSYSTTSFLFGDNFPFKYHKRDTKSHAMYLDRIDGKTSKTKQHQIGEPKPSQKIDWLKC